MIALMDNTVLSNFTVVEQADLVRLAMGENTATSEMAWAELQTGIRIGKLPPQDWSWLPVLSLVEGEKSLYYLMAQRLNAGEAPVWPSPPRGDTGFSPMIEMLEKWLPDGAFRFPAPWVC